MNKFLLSVVFPVFIVEVIANSAWIMVSYDERVRNNVVLSYTISILAAGLSGLAWCYLAQSMRQDQMFVTNMFWDASISIIFITLPIFMYGVRLDTQTTIGAVIAIIGLLLMKA